MRSKSTNNQINSMKVDSSIGMSLPSGGMDSLQKKSILFELKEEALFAKYKERIQKQNNHSTSSLRKFSRSPSATSLATPSSSKNNQSATHKRVLSQFDKNKFEVDRNIILPMPQVSINYLTKYKKPTNFKSEKRGSYDYIEVDKKKYHETLKYLNQQQIQAERDRRKGSVKLKQRLMHQSTPSTRKNRSIYNSPDYNSPKHFTPKHNTFEESYNNITASHTRHLSNFSSYKNQAEQEQLADSTNNNSQQQLQPSFTEFYSQPRDQIQNENRRSSFFRRQSLNKSFSNLFQNDGRAKINSTYFLQNQHMGRPSHLLSTFANNAKDKDQTKTTEREDLQNTLRDEQETATTVKNHTNDLNALIRQRLGSTRRSSNISLLSEDEKLKERSNSFLFRGTDHSKQQRQSFFQSIPYNKHIFETIQKNSTDFKQDVLKNMNENKFLADLNKYKEKRANKDSKEVLRNEVSGLKQFAINHFAPNSLDRLKTFFSFAFTSVDKGENKQITSALNEILDNLNTQGTMQIIDLWSAKSLKNCIERTNMSNERSVIQQFLYYKAKYDTIKKEEKKQQSEILSRQKEENLKSQLIRQEQARKQLNQEIQNRDSTFILEDDDTQYIHNQQMLMNSSQFNIRYKKALNTIIEEIKDMRQENIDDIKNTKLEDKIQKKISADLEKKYRFSKILKNDQK